MDAPPQDQPTAMRDEAAYIADPQLLHVWLRGWCRARGTSLPTAAFGGWHVAVDQPEQKARLVFAGASPSLSEASVMIREPHIFLKACASADMMAHYLAPGWVMRAPGFFMESPLLDASPPARQHPPVFLHTDSEQVLRASVIREQEVAACGSVVLVDGFAIFDQIRTHEAHRRQGFGHAIMTRLGAAAYARGARHGLLVATQEGRALYESMGWRLHSLYSTAVRPTSDA